MRAPRDREGRRFADAPFSFGRIERWAVIGAVTFAAVAVGAGFVVGGGDAFQHLKRIDAVLVLTLLALSLLNYGVRIARWLMFTRATELPVPGGRNSVYFLAGFAMSTTPGKLGEAVRLWFMRRGHDLPYERTAGLMIADRLSDAAAALLLTLAGLGGVFAGHGWTVAALVAIVAAASAVLLMPGWSVPMVNTAYRMVGRAPRLFGSVRRMLIHTGRLGSPGLYLAGLGLGLVGWGAEALALWVLLDAMGADVGLLQAVFVFCFAMLVGAIAMLPGGLGGTEVSMVGLLIALGVSPDIAIGATAVIRITTLWFAVALGFAVLPLAMRLIRPDGGEPRPKPAGEAAL